MSYKIEEFKELCKNNKDLLKFVIKFYNEYFLTYYDAGTTIAEVDVNSDINTYKEYGWEWDLDIENEESSILGLATCNHDYRDDEDWDGDGWQLNILESHFLNYLKSFDGNLDKIRLSNGNIVFLIDHEGYFSFQEFDESKRQIGKCLEINIEYPNLSL